MENITTTAAARLGPVADGVVLTRADYRELLPLASASRRPGDAADNLAEKLETARIVESAAVPPAVVTLNTEMEVRDEASGHVARLILVNPREANIVAGRISVLTPVGAALLGLTEGASTTVHVPSGEEKRLSIVRILMQPEARQRHDDSAV